MDRDDMIDKLVNSQLAQTAATVDLTLAVKAENIHVAQLVGVIERAHVRWTGIANSTAKIAGDNESAIYALGTQGHALRELLEGTAANPKSGVLFMQGVLLFEMAEIRKEQAEQHRMLATRYEPGSHTAVEAVTNSFNKLLDAPTKSQFIAIILIAILGIAVCSGLAIRSQSHADELEHRGVEMRRK